MRLQVNCVGDSGRWRRPVGIFLQLEVQVHVARPGGPVPLAEQPGQEGRGPALIGQLEKHQQSSICRFEKKSKQMLFNKDFSV